MGLHMDFTSGIIQSWRNKSAKVFMVFMLKPWWCLISYITSIIVPVWIMFTITLSFTRMHGTIINVSWCRAWRGRVFMEFLLVSRRMSAKHQFMQPGTEELQRVVFWKMNLNAKGWLLCLLYDRKMYISLYGYTVPWMKKEITHGILQCIEEHGKVRVLEVKYQWPVQNLSTGDVNVADKLWNRCPFDHWLREFN